MSGNKNFSWMVKPRGFIKLVGGEYELMQKAGGTVLFKFYLSSVIILFIAVISFLSIAYAIELLFHAILVEILLSTFLSTLFVLLFIFIVNTFTKDAKRRNLFNASNLTRLGFVMFVGFIISKPIEAFLYRNAIAGDIEAHKVQLVNEHGLKIGELFYRDLDKLSQQKSKYVSMNAGGQFGQEISQIDRQVALIDQKKKGLASTSAIRIDQGAYFIYRIKIISGKYPGAWMISLAIVALFLAPVFLVYSVSSDEEYFKRKNAQEKRLVENAYKAFMEKYAEIFATEYGRQLEFYSKYEDSPFNTKLKKPAPCRSASDFHERYAQA